jgi:hypothetical protein
MNSAAHAAPRPIAAFKRSIRSASAIIPDKLIAVTKPDRRGSAGLDFAAITKDTRSSAFAD